MMQGGIREMSGLRIEEYRLCSLYMPNAVDMYEVRTEGLWAEVALHNLSRQGLYLMGLCTQQLPEIL